MAFVAISPPTIACHDIVSSQTCQVFAGQELRIEGYDFEVLRPRHSSAVISQDSEDSLPET